MPLKRSEYNAILRKNKKRQEFKEKLRKYTESYTNPKKITDTNETARFVEQTKPVQTGGSPALTVESNPAYINNMSGASARQTLAQNAPYGKVFDKDAFMRQQAISAVTPTTIRSSDNFTANALQRAANSAANNMAIAYTGDPSKKNTPLASVIDASVTFKNVSDEFTKEYNELLDLNLQYKQAKAKISGGKKGTISKDAEEHAAKANEISALIDAKRKKVDALSNQLDTMAAMNPAVYSSKRTYPDGRTMYIPSKEKVNSAFFGNVAYLGDRASQGVQSSTDDIRDFLSNMTYGLPQQFSSLVQGKEAMDNARNAWQEHKDKIALENVEKQENRAQDTYERYSPTITENGAMQLLGDLSENIGYNAPYQLLAMIPGVGTGLSTTARFGGSYIDAYGNARKAGASVEQANLAGTLEGFNQGVGELVLGGINGAGSSRILQGLSKAGLKVSNPLVKAGLNAAGAALEEGLEEVEQDIISYFIEKTYNPDAKLNAKDLAYSGLLGALSAAPNAAISIPSHARAYSSDVKLMNSYITAVSSVSSDTEVNAIIEAGDNIIKACDEMASAAKEQGGEEGKEAQNRAETIAKTIKNTQETLNKNKDAVIKGNQDKKSALDNVVNNSKGDVVKNLANLVDEVSKGNNTGKNDYKATVDYILNQQAEAEAKYQQAASIEDTETAAKYAADSAAYAEAVRQLRNNQKEVQKARASEETYGDVTAEETKTTVAEANTTADEAKTATAETSENAAKSSETTVKQETPKEKGDSLRDSILKEHGILGVNKDIDTAADDIVAKYGSYKNAVDKIIEAQKNVREDTTISDEEKQTQISRLQDIIRSIRNRNTARQREAIENFSKIVKKYGLEGVEFIDVESDDVRSSPKVNGYYDPATKKIYVSPYSQDIQTSGSIVVHELTHHGATADHALVNDILKAKDTLVSKGQYSEELFDYSKYETTYKAETEKYINSEDGKTEIAALVKNGMTEEQAIAEAAKGYVNEEIAAHFMQEIMSNDDALKRLAKEDRPLLKRILDAIVNFFSGKKHRNERMAMLAADKIRSILRATEDVKVDNSRGKKPKATKPMQNIADENAKVGNTSDNRRFSLTRSTEEAGDLIAVHNVTEDKLKKILGADGMPMPSIAVAKADIGHSDFGNISLVFGSETVDPKANRKNKVYSADVWSPTFPSVEYEVNQATESRIVALYNSIKSKYGSDVAKALYPYYTNLSSELDSKGGAKGIVSSLSNDTKMMNVFLADTGETPVKNVVKETSTEMNANTREMGQYLIDTLGKEFVNEANPVNGETAISARNRFLESHEQELRNALQRYYENNGLDEETAKTVVDATRKGELMSQLVKPAKSILSGNTTTIDYEATNEKILDTVDKKQYKEWLNNLFGDAVKNEGIRNGKDPFTPSGNRRSFSATHYPVTLDNIVKAMRGSENIKGATTMTENAKAIRSASAEEYKSIDAIHKNEGRLQKMSESEITAQWNAFDNRLYAIIDSLMDSVPTIDDRLIESRRIGQVIIETSRNPTESNIRSTLEKYSGKGAWYKFTDQTVSDIQSLVNDIREAPTNIFEAKPERVVGLDEVKYAVVPDDLSKETVRAIADKGIEVRTYESGNEESRLETLNKLDGVRFSKDVDAEAFSYDALVSKPDMKIVNNDSNVLENVETLYALSNKKESVAHYRLDSGDNLRLDTDSYISISDFLDIVKNKYSDVLPKDVLKTMNVERKPSSVSDSMRYSKDIDTEYMNAVETGDMDKAREMVRQAAEEKGFTNAIPEQASSYITRTKAAPKNTIKVYKVFTVAPDGSPTALFVSSTTKLPMNVWLDAVDTYHFKADNGKEYVPSTQNPYTKGGKTGASVTIPNEQVRSELVERGYLNKDSKAAKITALAYRPGWHAGDLPFFPQGGKQGNPRFTNSGNVNKAFNPDIQETAYENIHRYNQVVFECEMAADTNYTEIAQNQEKAKTKSGSVNQRNADLQYMPTDGFYYYTTNPTISEKGKWAISGSLKINRALTQQECDDILSKNGFKPQEWEGGTLDLEKLGYTGEKYDAARKTLAPITYDDDGNVIPISERFNKDIKDVRYSKDVFTQEEREKIISKGYTDYLTRQFVVKDKSGEYAKAISMTARKKLAQQLAKPLNGVTVNDTLAAITPVFETIEKTDGTPEQRAAKAYEAAENAANTILSMVKDANTNPLYEQYSDLRTYLRTTKLDTSSVKADIADYNEWRKSHMGSMKLGNDGTQIDTAYQELSDMYPEFFPADIVNPADQLIRMGDVSDKLKKVMENPILSQEGSESIVRGFANAILAGYENSAETTLAAKNKQSEEDFARFVTTITRAYETDVRNLSKQLDSSNAKIEKMAESIAKKDETGRRETSRKKALSGVSRLQKAMNEPTLSKNIPENWKKVVETFLKAMGNEDYKNAKKSTHEPKFDPHEALSALAEMQSYVNDFQNSKESTIRMSADQIKNLEWQISGIRASLEDYIHNNKDNLSAKGISLVTSQDANWLANIADLTQTINHLIKQENELFVGKKKMDAEQFASELIEQINERKRKFQKTGEEDSDIKKWITNSQFDYVAPDIYLHMLGERGDDLANAYRLGQDKISANKQKYVDAIKELVGENFSAEKSSIRGELIDVKINGDEMKVSRQQLMSMYVLWYRPQARQHMETGGVFFLNRNGEPQGKPVVITQSIFNDLAKNLTKDDIRIANGIRNFLSTECAEWGNEASMEMYGYKKFNDPNYFPINVHGDTLAYNVGKAPDSNVLERKGFTKKVDPKSIKPIDIRDIFDVADKHVEDMTMYAGYAPINSTTLRIYNAPGVKSAIREQYGNNAVRYMEGFLYKANGLANENNTASPKLYYWNKLANAGKKAAVAFNISTAAKQPLSYFRAGIELDTKYLVNAWSDVLPKKKYDALLQEMNDNSGIAKIKSLGYSDVGMGHDTRSQYSDQTFKGAYKKGEYIKNKFEDASMYLAGKADERTWVRIWDACKMKVEAENGKLTHQELMSLTTEKFNQVIGRTQVVDSLMDTAPIAYDPKFKAFFPFSNEPIKTMATLYYTWNDMKKGKGKEGFTKAVSSIVLTNLILEPLVSSMMGVWRDKEDEDPLTYIEKVIEHWTGLGIGEDSETSSTSIITSEMVDGVFVDPILSGLFEIFTDIIQGYSGDVMNSSGLYDLGESSKRLLNAIMKGEDYKGEKSTYNLTMEFIASVAQILGVPANTLRRDTNAAIRTVLYYAQNVIPASNIARWELNKLYYNLGNKSARTEKYFYDILVDAYNQEDKTAYNIMREDLDKMGIQSKEIVGIIEKRGGVIKPGTSVWNTEVQARFDLPTKSTGNKVEQMVTRVYTACQKIDTLDENKALPKRPDKYYYTNDDGDKVEMTTQEYDKFVEDVGVLRYKLCAEMAASNGWNKLNAEQQLYALTKAYDFAARYYRQKFNKDYNSGDTWMKELYGTQFRNKEVASTIISKAFKK